MTQRIDRRGFLEQGAALAGLLAGGSSLLAARGAQASHAPAASDLVGLAARLDGRVVLPQTPGYGAARVVWNGRYDDARPEAVIQVASAADVREVVDFARARDRRLIVRSGGHSFGGYSTGDDLVVDLSRLTAVEISPDGERARIGAGSTMLPTYRALWRQRKAIAAGTCPTVGITGLTTGGGLGVLSRRHGLTCDNLLEVEIVTADGRLLRANEGRHADLYWATRGGGGGNFGIITTLTFRLVPVDMPFTYLEYEFRWSAAEDVLAAWQDWLPGSPRATSSAVQLLTRAPETGDSPMVMLEIVHAGPQDEAEAIVADLLGAVGAPATVAAAQTGPFVDLQHDSYCMGLRPKECQLVDRTITGVLARPAFYAKSDVSSGPWPRQGLATLIEWIERRQRDRTLTPRNRGGSFSPDYTVGKVLMEAADGAVNSIAPDATAFVHRDNLFVSQYQARWRPGSPPHVADANREWANGLYAAVEPYRSGFGYQNYIDPSLGSWKRAYYGTNLARLRKVKSRYDPENFFRFAQSIPRS